MAFSCEKAKRFSNKILLEAYNQMRTNNKINTREQNIDVENAQFQQFVQKLKEQRPMRSTQLEHSEVNISQLSQPPISDQECSPISKDLYSERSRSLHLHTNRISQVVPHIFDEDKVLQNKKRFGAANRYTIKQYQLPPQYFTPTKVKLQQYLKDSRILPKAEQLMKERANPEKKQSFNEPQISYLNEKDRRVFNASNSMKKDLKKNSSDFRIRNNSNQRQPKNQQFQNTQIQKNMASYHDFGKKQLQIDPWSYIQKYSQVKKAKLRNQFNQMMQFSYPFDNDLIQQESKRFRSKNRGNHHHPENNIVWNRASHHKEKSKQMGNFTRMVRPIREETDFGQQEPLQLKC